MNFDELINRRGTNSYKWDKAPSDDVLPLWVADMDFQTAPCITEALRRRVEHGVFGYTFVPERYYEAVQHWFCRRHGWQIERDWILYTIGVVPAISATIKALTQPGDKVLVQTPVYNCFFSSIRNNGCEVVASPLLYDQHTYTMDFDDLERKAADPAVKILLLCNPHNPAGRVWTREELLRLGEICLRNQVTVLSDEIHCEFVFEDHKYVPFATLSDELRHHSVSFCSPSKTFNTAGLQIANIVSDDPAVRRRIDRAINVNEVCDVNPFGIEALIAAYEEGEPWLNELLAYIWGNYQFLLQFFREHLPHLPVARLEGTYLAWVDISALGIPSDRLCDELLEKAKVWLNAGTMYGPEGKDFVRINLACPRSRLQEALERIAPHL